MNMNPTFCCIHGIRFYGPNALLTEFDNIPIEYDSDVFQPDCTQNKIVLPVNRGQIDYQVHTYTIGGRKTLTILKDGEVTVIQVMKNSKGVSEPKGPVRLYC